MAQTFICAPAPVTHERRTVARERAVRFATNSRALPHTYVDPPPHPPRPYHLPRPPGHLFEGSVLVAATKNTALEDRAFTIILLGADACRFIAVK